MARGDDGKQAGGVLDSLGRLFRAREEAPPKEQPAAKKPASGLETLEAAIHALQQRVEQQRGAGAAAGIGAGSGVRKATPEELAAERERRIEAAQRAMREDIEKMHARLGTGIGPADLDAIAALLAELDAEAAAGKGSHELLPRARRAILERLRAESGELAVARVTVLLQQHQMEWPDPSRPPASATPEEIERARRRRLADVRRAFLSDGFARLGESLKGIVKGWGADYPDRGSPLWEACVLEGVAAGVRGRLVQRFVEVLRGDREHLLAEAEAAVGQETAALQQALAGGVHSLEEANRAVQGALQVLDEVLPAIAWKRVCAQVPEARGGPA